MKKLLLSLGAIAAVVTPIASVVACGAPAKPAPIALDKTKVEAILPKIKAAVEDVIANPNTKQPDMSAARDVLGTSFTEGVVEDGSNFIATIKVGNMFIILHMTPEGTITSASLSNASKEIDLPSNILAEVKKEVKEGTVDHSKDTAAIEYNLIKADYDQDIVNDMDLEFPTIADSPSNDEMRTYNKETEAFLAEYNELAGNAAYEIMNGPIELAWTEQEYFDLELPSGTDLDEDLMNKLHMPQDVITKLMKLINGKVTITVHKVKTTNENAQNLEFYIPGATTNEGGNTWFVGKDQITFA